jgi:hypothetical protein
MELERQVQSAARGREDEVGNHGRKLIRDVADVRENGIGGLNGIDVED